MERRLSQKLRKLFPRRLMERVPRFVPIAPSVHGPRTGQVVLGWHARESLWFFITLEVMEKWDRFALEGGWSTDANFPYDMLPTGLAVAYPEFGHPRGQPVDGRFRFRVSELWEFPSPEFLWYVSDESLDMVSTMQYIREGTSPPKADLVDDAVEDAVARIEQHLIPYYEQHLRESSPGS